MKRFSNPSGNKIFSLALLLIFLSYTANLDSMDAAANTQISVPLSGQQLVP